MASKNKHCYSFLVRSAYQVARRHGITSETLLADTGLNSDIFDDLYLLIEQSQELLIYRNLIQAIDKPDIGLDVGLQAGVTELGAAGHGMMAAPTIRAVFKGNQKRSPMLYSHLNWEPRLVDDDVIHYIADIEPLGDLRIFMIDRLSALIQKLAEELIGPDCSPTLVTFDFPKPRYWQRYEAIFHCPIKFDQPGIEIHYPFKFLDKPIISHDPKVQEVLEGLADTLMNKLSAGQDISTDVILALKQKPGVFPGIEKVAEQLNISSRTLRRRLAQQGISFQDLLNKVRQDVAEEHLTSSNMHIQQIAELCGFSDAQNFSQAFKRWTGMSPSQFRSSQP